MAQMIPLEDYVAQVLETLSPLENGQLALEQAHGRVLAEDVTAVVPVPPWTNSAMDGYAVRAGETAGASPQTPVVLPVTGDIPAGAAPQPLAAGTAQRIMTGAMLPEGADAVVKVEDTDQAPGPRPLPERVELRAGARPG
ncbi:MoeA region, partial [Actinomyces johnsonii F0542]